MVSQKKGVQWDWLLFFAGEKCSYFIPYCGKATIINSQLYPTCVFMSPQRSDLKKSPKPVIKDY